MGFRINKDGSLERTAYVIDALYVVVVVLSLPFVFLRRLLEMDHDV